MRTVPLREAFVLEFVQKWEEVWKSGDVDRILPLLADDIVFDDPTFPETLHGREAVREFLEVLFRAFPKMDYEVLGEPYLSLDRTGVALAYRVMTTMEGELDPPGFAPTGQPVEFLAVDLYQFRDGLLSDYTIVFDMMGVGRQIGAAPEPGTFAERMGVFMQRLAARRMRRRAR
jgi:steroid delta-isomerase-like uncharacterized protein